MKARSWLNSVVVVRANTLTREIDLRSVRHCDLETGLVFTSVQPSATAQAGFGLGRANELYHRLETDERLPGPVSANLAE